MQLNENQVKQLNDFSNFLKFKKTWPFLKLINSPDKVIALFTGNQFGKTAGVAFQYVMRILGIHPIIERNVSFKECSCNCGNKWRMYEAPEKCECGGEVILHNRQTRIFRFCSETLPGGGSNKGATSADPGSNENTEVRNTQYPALKKWLPGFLIKNDITWRDHKVVVYDPFGGPDIIFEFVGYNQAVKSTAGVQRLSIWYDEQPDKDFREEQIPRLFVEDGDEIFSVTPADYLTWMYDEIFENARVYYRTKAICDFLEIQDGEKSEQVKKGNSEKSITVIQAATDDNPTLSKKAIDGLFDNIDDSEVIAIRRYGLFKQVSGRVFKDFEQNVHVIKESEYFEYGIPKTWVFGRGIDYHPQTPWAFGGMALSPRNEAFIFVERNLSPERFTTEEQASNIGDASADYHYTLSIIDPLSKAFKRIENGKSVTILDDLNNSLRSLGYSKQGYFQTWDTKGERGRDEIRKRLKNAKKCGKPFSNEQVVDGVRTFLPTIWILDSCQVSIKSMRQWRWEEYADGSNKSNRESKNKPEQKWSHINMVWEALFKNPIFRFNASQKAGIKERELKYFQRR
jgi:hypothetical protein